MTAEHAAAALYDARDALYRGEGPDMFQDSDIVYGEWLSNRADALASEHVDAPTAADTVIATARRLCCGDNPAPHHAATDAHSQRMAFAEELARAVRGS